VVQAVLAVGEHVLRQEDNAVQTLSMTSFLAVRGVLAAAIHALVKVASAARTATGTSIQ